MLEDVPSGLQLLDLRNRDGLDEYLSEIERLTHNFVAGAASLRDHTRRIMRSYEGTAIKDSYNAKVAELFGASGQMVLELRNYILHYALPASAASTTWRRDPPEYRSYVSLDRDSLLRYDGWSSAVKAHLRGMSDERVDLRLVVEGYYEAVNAFYEWLDRELREHNAAELAEFQRIAFEHDEIVERLAAPFGQP